MAERSLPAVLATLPGQVFAVLDGARLPGLDARLRAHAVAARPLFLGPTEAERQAGPQLAGPLSPAARAAVLSLCPDPTARVFWAMDQHADAADRLTAHLRRINAVRGPATNGTPPPGTTPSDPGIPGTDDVLLLLRHADTLTLTLLAQVMTRAQATLFLGPATGILFEDARSGQPVWWDASAVAQLPDTFAQTFSLRPAPNG